MSNANLTNTIYTNLSEMEHSFEDEKRLFNKFLSLIDENTIQILNVKHINIAKGLNYLISGYEEDISSYSWSKASIALNHTCNNCCFDFQCDSCINIESIEYFTEEDKLKSTLKGINVDLIYSVINLVLKNEFMSNRMFELKVIDQDSSDSTRSLFNRFMSRFNAYDIDALYFVPVRVKPSLKAYNKKYNGIRLYNSLFIYVSKEEIILDV